MAYSLPKLKNSKDSKKAEQQTTRDSSFYDSNCMVAKVRSATANIALHVSIFWIIEVFTSSIITLTVPLISTEFGVTISTSNGFFLHAKAFVHPIATGLVGLHAFPNFLVEACVTPQRKGWKWLKDGMCNINMVAILVAVLSWCNKWNWLLII